MRLVLHLCMSHPSETENTVESLRALILELYVSAAVLRRDVLAPEEEARLLDTLLAAGEGLRFAPLGLPFPRE